MDKTEIKSHISTEITKTIDFITDCKSSTEATAPDCAIDHSLRMEKLTEDELTLKTLRKAEQKLLNLKKVLSQLETKQFGLCQNCKSPIPIQRILIRPESLLCVKCSE